MFGAPEFDVKTDKSDRIIAVDVTRGAPCGASWDAADKIVGLSANEAVIRIGLETQFFCTANPAGWDPINGKSPVHFAGDVHSAALKRGIEKNRKS